MKNKEKSFESAKELDFYFKKRRKRLERIKGKYSKVETKLDDLNSKYDLALENGESPEELESELNSYQQKKQSFIRIIHNLKTDLKEENRAELMKQIEAKEKLQESVKPALENFVKKAPDFISKLTEAQELAEGLKDLKYVAPAYSENRKHGLPHIASEINNDIDQFNIIQVKRAITHLLNINIDKLTK